MSNTEFKVGDVVQLKCGGPAMVVNNYDENSNQVNCLWPLGDTDTNEKEFYRAILRKFVPPVTILGVTLGQNVTLKQAFKACKEYEQFVNTDSSDESLTRYRVLPILGDKGTLEIFIEG